MSPSENDTNSTADGTFSIDRRDVLKLAGGAVVGVGAFAGTASASNTQFMGCSQICAGTDEDDAVVLTDEGYECRTLDKQDEDLAVERDEAPDIGFSAEVYACYEAAEDEAIVGVLHHEQDEDAETSVCGLCLNPNDCAAEYYESKEEILSSLDCDRCDEIQTECIGYIFDSNGEPVRGTESAETTENA